MKERIIESFDGNKICCYLWDNVKNPVGVVQIFHGMAEHATRYDEFAKFLNKNGYIVFADDHRGHGKTAGSVENIGKYEGGNIFFDTAQDEKYFAKLLKEEYNLPIYLFGHSYGSFVALHFIQTCNLYEKVVLSGSSYMKRQDAKFAHLVSKITKKFKGEKAPAKLVEKLSFVSYNKKFHDNGSWLNSDKEKTQEYYSDPQCGLSFSAKFYDDLFSAFNIIFKNENLYKIDDNKKILILSGKEDPVSKMGKLVIKLYRVFKEHDLRVAMKLYAGARHEIIHDTTKETVFQDVLDFFNGKAVDAVGLAIKKKKELRAKRVAEQISSQNTNTTKKPSKSKSK